MERMLSALKRSASRRSDARGTTPSSAARGDKENAGDAGDTPVFRMDFSDPTSAIDTLLAE